MAIQKTEAIVLRTQPFRSSSLIITFFTKDFGKLKGIAKGVRHERQLRSSTFELFTGVEIIFYEKSRSDLHLISDSFVLNTYSNIRTKLESISYASYFAEMIDQLCEVHDPHEEIYHALDRSLKYLSSISGQRIARLFEVKLMNEIGWLPYFQDCFACQKDGLEEGFFSVRQGGLLCHDCASKFPDAYPISAESLKTMRFFILKEFEEAVRIPISKASETGLERLMRRFMLDRLNKPLKSQIFLESVRSALKPQIQ